MHHTQTVICSKITTFLPKCSNNFARINIKCLNISDIIQCLPQFTCIILVCIAAGYIVTQAKSYEFVIVFLQHGFESFRNRSLKISGGGGGGFPKWHGKNCDPPESTCEMLRPPPSIGSRNIRPPPPS